jgi:hypothetical protein
VDHVWLMMAAARCRASNLADNQQIPLQNEGIARSWTCVERGRTSKIGG